MPAGTKLSALEQWKARSVRDIELPSGTKVTLRLTNVQDEILAGSFSAPVLSLAKKIALGNVDLNEDIDEDALRNAQEYMQTMMAKAIVALDGQPIELTIADVKDLPQDDIDEIWLYIRRLKKLPAPNA